MFIMFLILKFIFRGTCFKKLSKVFQKYFIQSGQTFKPIELETRGLHRSIGNLKGFNLVTNFFQISWIYASKRKGTFLFFKLVWFFDVFFFGKIIVYAQPYWEMREETKLNLNFRSGMEKWNFFSSLFVTNIQNEPEPGFDIAKKR